MLYDNDVENLERLGGELAARGFRVQVITPEGRLPSLVVTSPHATMLSETVIVGTGTYFWPWGDRIAPVADVGTAAEAVARVLASSPPP
jgi:hypothetical protein